MTDPEDCRLFEELVDQAVLDTTFPLRRKAFFFYCYAYPDLGFSDALYYVEDMQCVVVVKWENGTLFLQEIFFKNTLSHT